MRAHLEQLLLSDDQYLTYLRDGYVVIQPEFDDAFHELLYQRAHRMYQQVGDALKPGIHLEVVADNLRARAPELDRLFGDPVVRGALTSILGEDYLLYPHSFLHRAETSDQRFHQDCSLPWSERGHYDVHRPDWVMLCYYPQAVDADNGPTELVPGTQYWTRDFERQDGSFHAEDSLDPEWAAERMGSCEDLAARDSRLQGSLDALGIPGLQRRFIQVPRGAVVVIHHDLIHRGSRRLPEAAARYMFKFYLARTKKPTAPTWDCKLAEPDLSGTRGDLRPVVRALWQWSAGRPISSASSMPGSEAALHAAGEHDRIRAAYELGSAAAYGEGAALELLACAVDDQREAVRRAACYGLVMAGEAAASALITAATAKRAATRRIVAFALGCCAQRSRPAIDVLIDLLADPDYLVRSNAAYGLGQVMREPDGPWARIVEALLDRLDHGCEPDNTLAGGLRRSTVREEIAAALVQGASNHEFDARSCERLAAFGLRVTDRYVSSLIIEALSRQPQASLAQVLPFLVSRAYYPSP